MISQPWAQTYSGRAFPLMTPAAGDIDWRDMAIALGRICRWGGHTRLFFSVAQHCVLTAKVMDQAVRTPSGRDRLLAATTPAHHAAVARDLRRAAIDDGTATGLILAALLHDGHEAYIGDITTPVSMALSYYTGGHDWIGALKARIDTAIYAAAGLPWPLPAAWGHAVKAADRIMLATEKRDLMADGPDWLDQPPDPAPFAITPEPEHRAGDTFLATLAGLLDTRCGR